MQQTPSAEQFAYLIYTMTSSDWKSLSPMQVELLLVMLESNGLIKEVA